jgi:hypothetical protein
LLKIIKKVDVSSGIATFLVFKNKNKGKNKMHTPFLVKIASILKMFHA